MFLLHTDRSENPPLGKGAIIDTCVLVDIALSSRSRHVSAIELARCLRTRQITIRVPMHAAFEFTAAMLNEIHQMAGKHSSWASKPDEYETIHIWAVPNDHEFLGKYSAQQLPDTKAGDLIFLAMAAGDGQPLITEDNGLLKKAQQAKIMSSEPLIILRRSVASEAQQIVGREPR